MRRSVDLERRLQEWRRSFRLPSLELQTPSCPLPSLTSHQLCISTLHPRDLHPPHMHPGLPYFGPLGTAFLYAKCFCLNLFQSKSMNLSKSSSKTTSSRKSSLTIPHPYSPTRKDLLLQVLTEVDPSTHQPIWPGTWVFGASNLPIL